MRQNQENNLTKTRLKRECNMDKIFNNFHLMYYQIVIKREVIQKNKEKCFIQLIVFINLNKVRTIILSEYDKFIVLSCFLFNYIQHYMLTYFHLLK